jgi:hypothetical protein
VSVRGFSAAAFVLVLATAGAVAGVRLTAPGDAARRGAPSVSARAGDAVAPVQREVPLPGGVMDLTVRAPDGRLILTTTVGALAPVAVGDGYAPIDPPRWNQAVWVRYRPLVPPMDTTRGTSYVYGHACHHHTCAFTDLFHAAGGGSITLSQGARVVRYRIVRTSADFPKSGAGSLAARTSGVANRSVPDRLVLITCAYESGDVSLNNFVVVASRA